MNGTTLGLLLAAVTVAQVARADDWNGDGYDDHHAAPVFQQHGRGCGPRPTYAPAGATMASGRYELQNVQRWVPGQQQQVWVNGSCDERRRGRGGWRRCTQGHYRTVWTPGRYETRQEWVWVAYQQPRYPQQYGVGFSAQGSNGAFTVSVY